MSPVLAGRVAVVTGAARGIGRAAAVALAEAGAEVHGIDLLEVAPPLLPWRLDVTDAAALEGALAAIAARAGAIDVLVNNAGIITLAGIEATTLATFDRIMAVNIRAAFVAARAVVPGMKARRRGSIVNVSSNAGRRGQRLETAYTASKHALEGLSAALADELAPWGVAVNTITPGHPVHTAMSETTYGPEARAAWIAPAALGPAFVHLAAQDASGITGQHVRAWDLVRHLAGGGNA